MMNTIHSSRGMIQLPILIAIVGVLFLGGIGLSVSKKSSEKKMMEEKAMEEKAMMEKDAMMKSGPDTAMKKDEAMMKKEDEAMMKKDAGAMMDKSPDGTMVKGEQGVVQTGSYVPYISSKVAMASESHDVVLFFRASWCPTCKAIDADIKAHVKDIPPSLTILDVNYDDSTDLKKKYGVTYQHTFVQVDGEGNLVKKWSGSPTLSALIAEVK